MVAAVVMIVVVLVLALVVLGIVTTVVVVVVVVIVVVVVVVDDEDDRLRTMTIVRMTMMMTVGMTIKQSRRRCMHDCDSYANDRMPHTRR